jgi:aminopeptidase N
MRAMEEASGKSLGRFFEQWVHKPGHPELEVALSWEKGVLSISVKQHQATTDGVPSAFELPLHVDIAEARGGRREKLRITQKTEVFAIACAQRPAHVVIDPEMRILGDVRLKVPGDMLRAQLAGAKTGRGRWLAARALATSDDPPTIQALEAALRNEKEVWLVRVEAAQALGQIRSKDCFNALARAVSIKHPKVRRSVADALSHFRTLPAVDLLKKLALKDESYVVEAEAARALGKTKQPSAFETLVDVLDRPSWADIISVGAIDGLAAMRDERALPHVVARTRYGHPARTRRAAVMALPKIASDRKCRETLEDLLDDSDTMLRLDVARALGELGDAKARGPLRERLEVELDPRVRRRLRESIRDLGHEGKRPHDSLRDDLDKMDAEHKELRGRVAALEAQASATGRETSKGAHPAKAATAVKAVRAKNKGAR